MPNLKEVRNRISSVKNTQQITRAMKMVAAAKVRKAQDNLMKFRPYQAKMQEIISNLLAAGGESADLTAYTQTYDVERLLIIMVTGDRGLCGAFNMNVIKEVLRLTSGPYAEQYKAGGITLLPIGKKGYDFFRRRKFNLETSFYEKYEGSFTEIKAAAEFAQNGFLNGDFDKVVVVYNEFINVITQVLHADQMLPMVTPDAKSAPVDYIFDPSGPEIISELLPKAVNLQLYRAVLESLTAEQGARMAAMDQATDNAGELINQLQLEYNRTRQALITREITEIVAGAL